MFYMYNLYFYKYIPLSHSYIFYHTTFFLYYKSIILLIKLILRLSTDINELKYFFILHKGKSAASLFYKMTRMNNFLQVCQFIYSVIFDR